MTHIESIGFIGGGRVTRILLAGWVHAGVRLPHVVVSEPSADARGALAKLLPDLGVETGDAARAAEQDLVLLALPAQAIIGVLPSVRPALRDGALLVSLAPTVTLAQLSELLGGFSRLARCVPNAPSMIGAGYNPLAFGPGLGLAERQALAAFFQPLGQCPEVPEATLEGFTLLTGMGPTYLWFQLQTLRELAGRFGLNDAQAAPALASMASGAARLLLEGNLAPAEVMDLVVVKPLAEDEAAIQGAYQARLPAVYSRIKP
jgi:pyrroline-5-carboxylate reductase